MLLINKYTISDAQKWLCMVNNIYEVPTKSICLSEKLGEEGVHNSINKVFFKVGFVQ